MHVQWLLFFSFQYLQLNQWAVFDGRNFSINIVHLRDFLVFTILNYSGLRNRSLLFYGRS